jgi:hypothetical protein
MTEAKTSEAKGTYLEKKIVYLRLLPKPTEMVSDPKHIAYGGFDGALTVFTLGVDKMNRFLNPFKTDMEREFFERVFKTDLNIYSPKNEFWTNYKYSIIKDLALINVGKRFDLNDPHQALDYRAILTNKIVAPNWEKRKDNPFYKFAFYEEGYEEKEAVKTTDELEKIYEFFGGIKNSPTAMRQFLTVYYATNNRVQEVPVNADKEFLISEIKKIIDIDRKGYLKIVDDKDYETKGFITRAIDANAIQRKALNNYVIVGEEGNYTYGDLIALMQQMEEDASNPLYAKIIAVVNKSKKGK